jgi:hypothetical protein
MPFLSMREIWKQSDPDIDPELRFFPGTPGTPVLLIIWWVLWLASSAAANVSFQMEMSQAKPDDARLAASFGVASLLTMLAAVAAIMVVGDITERQTNRAAKIQRHSYSEEPPPPPADFED